MLIFTKVKDPNATLITMNDGTRYAFEPNEAGDYVAEVENTTHIERFLSIPEGYGIYSGEVIPADVAREALDQPDDDDDDDDEAPDDEGDTIPLQAMTETDLRALYEAELGRKPHHRAGMERLIDEITAHRATQE